jgi:DNA-binding GntR family transcriptional regulator
MSTPQRRRGISRISRRPSPSSLADAAYARLKQDVIHCELEPGLRVSEAKLVQRTGIGKTPVREALGRLVQEGLVRNIPRHGYEVTPITLRDVQELFGLRLVVEPAAVQLAAGHVDAAQLRRLDDLCHAGYEVGDHDSAAAFLRANRELHGTIARSSSNRRLAEVVERVLDECERLFHLGLMLRNRSDEMAHEHKDLVDALIAGDAEGARRIAIEQILSAQRMVVDALLYSPSLLAAQVAAPRLVKASA